MVSWADADVAAGREPGAVVNDSLVGLLTLGLELAEERRELAMRNLEAELRAEGSQSGRNLVDRLDAVVEVERLAATFALAFERLANQLLVVLAHVGANRPAALRRRLDDGDVA